MKGVPGVLVLGGTTYGRHDRERLYFRFVPRDAHDSEYLVPWKRDKMRNAYVVVSPCDDERGTARVVSRLGEVDDPAAMEAYSLYGIRFPTTQDRRLARVRLKDLHDPIALAPHDDSVIVIDPEGCQDADDAIGAHSDGGLAVYITDAPALLEKHGLWSMVSGARCTAYMPSGAKHMLCAELVPLATLTVGKTRRALRFRVVSNVCTGCDLSDVVVSRSYTYDDPGLVLDETYRLAADNVGPKCPHDIVATCMMAVNMWVGAVLKEAGTGVLRQSDVRSPLTSAAALLGWGPKAEYIRAADASQHAAFGGYYAHATSPMRRVVDMVNIVRMREQLGEGPSMDALAFCQQIEADCESVTADARQVHRAELTCRLYVACLSGAVERAEGRVVSASEGEGDDISDYTFWIDQWSVFAEARGPVGLEVGTVHDLEFHLFKHAHALDQKVRMAVIGCPNVFSLV